MRPIKLAIAAIALFATACQGGKSDSAYPILKVSLDKNIKTIDEVFKRVEVIALEDNSESAMRITTKVKEHDNIFYIYDGNRNNILRFTQQGKYIDKISRTGRARDEYIDISDFEIDTRSNTLLLVNTFGKIQEYDMQGNFIRAIELPSPPLNYYKISLNDSSNAFIWSCTMHDACSVNILNIDTEEFTEGFLPNSMPHVLAGGSISAFYEYQGNTYHYRALSGEVYHLTPESCEVAYKWDLGFDFIDPAILEKDVETSEESQAIQNGYNKTGEIPYRFVSQLQSDRYYCATIQSAVDVQYSTFLYDKKKKDYVYILDSERVGIVNLIPRYITEEYIMCSTRCEDMEAFLKYAQENNFKIIGNTESEFGDLVGHALVKLYL